MLKYVQRERRQHSLIIPLTYPPTEFKHITFYLYGDNNVPTHYLPPWMDIDTVFFEIDFELIPEEGLPTVRELEAKTFMSKIMSKFRRWIK